jgi:triosephosphate isomerase (TIM)
MKYVIGNLKMNILSPAERERYFSTMKKEIAQINIKNAKIILCVPFVHLESFVSVLKDKNISIGTQDIFWESKGSFTGETSPEMVKGLKAEYVIIGHSERRRYFGENNETANLKIKAALKVGLSPIYCVGEKKEERENGTEQEVISSQVRQGLSGISPAQLEKIILVYEPVWSVGSDAIPTCNEIMEMKILIKKILIENFGSKRAKTVPILYGGSVCEKNACSTCLESGTDGVLVGRESLTPHEFIKIADIIDAN